MAAPITRTLENRNAKRTSISISGPAYMVAVGGAPRDSKAKTRKYTVTISKRVFGKECCITSRYLRPSTGSCHDLCKYGMKDESLERKKPTTRCGSRKLLVMSNKGVKRTTVPAERIKKSVSAHGEPIEVIKQQNALPLNKIGGLTQSLSTSRKLTQNELKWTKKHVKEKSAWLNGQINGKEIKKIKLRGFVHKSTSVERVTPKVNLAGSLPRNSKFVSPLKDRTKMMKNKSNHLIAKKVTEMMEMTMHESKAAGLEFVPLNVEIIEPPPTLTTESINLPSSESIQSSLDKQVLEEEHEHNNNEVILSEVDYEMLTSEGNSNYRVVICDDKENGGLKVQFRRGEGVEVQSEDAGPRKLKFRRGKLLEDNGDEQSITRINFTRKPDEARNDCKNRSETVTLKHQEMQERKKAQELLNRVIEETANKLGVDRKTKVRALVGAFESVISPQDELLLTTC